MALCVAVVCAQLVVSLAGAPAAAQRRTRKGGSQTAVDAKSLFNQRCSKCHGSDGRANTVMGEVGIAPNLTDRGWQRRVSDRRLTNSITHGRGGMPAFRNKLSQKEIKALVAYIREFGKDGGAP